MTKVKTGDYVQVHYTGTLENGDVFDSSEGRAPLEFQAGGGMVIPGFNDAVMGMAIDEEKQVILPPDQAYGGRRNDMEREFSTEILGGNQVEVGQMLQFSSPRGPMPAQVLEVGEDKFKVDFNHPLAGKTLVFTIKVAGITDQPTQQQSCGCSCSSSSCGDTCG
jgi:peptidylprolyl isomerase